MAEGAVWLCAACRVELEISSRGDTGSCPACGLAAPMEVVEAEAEAALLEQGRHSLRRLDGDAVPGPSHDLPASRRFVVRL